MDRTTLQDDAQFHCTASQAIWLCLLSLLFSVKCTLLYHFYRASICEGGLRSRNSVCLSVRLSHAWIVTNLNSALQIFWYLMKGQSLCYSDTNSGWWATLPSLRNLHSKLPTPFEKCQLRHISAYNVSTVKDSEKSSIMTNIKLTTGFPMSYRWSAYVTPKSPKGWLKKRFFSFFE